MDRELLRQKRLRDVGWIPRTSRHSVTNMDLYRQRHTAVEALFDRTTREAA
ncbi:UNVERIFIED_CONTAM: hypothetical protein HHA_454910 [Hammondia hammondi]|eukprot:XP_008888596.1 hypothetical protein HHA_454910 [Hammondia hammondi]